MKILITGGAGYVGSALVPKLLDLGHDITVFDLMIYGERVFDNHKKLKKIHGDIRQIDLLSKIIPGHGGLLDRTDGIIFAYPFYYLILLAGLKVF